MNNNLEQFKNWRQRKGNEYIISPYNIHTLIIFVGIFSLSGLEPYVVTRTNSYLPPRTRGSGRVARAGGEHRRRHLRATSSESDARSAAHRRKRSWRSHGSRPWQRERGSRSAEVVQFRKVSRSVVFYFLLFSSPLSRPQSPRVECSVHRWGRLYLPPDELSSVHLGKSFYMYIHTYIYIHTREIISRLRDRTPSSSSRRSKSNATKMNARTRNSARHRYVADTPVGVFPTPVYQPRRTRFLPPNWIRELGEQLSRSGPRVPLKKKGERKKIWGKRILRATRRVWEKFQRKKKINVRSSIFLSFILAWRRRGLKRRFTGSTRSNSERSSLVTSIRASEYRREVALSRAPVRVR